MTADGRPLRDSLEDYLALRRALGFRLKTAGRLLDQFVSWLDDRGSDTITTEDALAWAVLPPGASQAWQSIRLSMVRGFAAYLHGTDPSVQVPPPGLIRRGNDRATPYIYSDAEISAIIAAAGTLRPRFRAATYQALISLLAASGVRIGEALSFDRGDLDADDGMLIVRDAKFGKTRLVPLHPSRSRRAGPVLGPAGRASPPSGRPGAVPVHRRDTAAAQQRQPHVQQAHRPGRAGPAVSLLPSPDP